MRYRLVRRAAAAWVVLLLVLVGSVTAQAMTSGGQAPREAGALFTPDEPGTAGVPAASADGFNPVLLALRLLLGLGLVLALVFVAGRLLAQRLGLPRGAGRYLAVLDTLPLGPGKGLLVVQAGRKRLLIGVSGDRLVLLRELKAEDWAEEPGPEGFPQALSQTVQARAGLPGEDLWQEAATRIRRQVERLRSRGEGS